MPSSASGDAFSSLDEAWESIRAELARHDAVLREFEKDYQRLAEEEETSHCELDEEFEQVIITRAAEWSAAVTEPRPSADTALILKRAASNDDDDDDAVVVDRGAPQVVEFPPEATDVGWESSSALVGHCYDREDHHPRIFTSAALQLVEEKLEQQQRMARKTGFLRKAARQGRSYWRFQRVELRRDAGVYWLTYIGVSDGERDPSKSLRVPRKKVAAFQRYVNSEMKERRVRLLPGGRTICVAAVDDPHKDSSPRTSLDAQTTDDVRRLLTKQTSLGRIGQVQEECIFALQVGDHISVWMASSPQERDDWMRAIAVASDASLCDHVCRVDDTNTSVKDEALADYDDTAAKDGELAFQNNNFNSTIATTKGAQPPNNIAEFEATIERVSRATCREEFIQTVRIPGVAAEQQADEEDSRAFPAALARFVVPVSWARGRALNLEYERSLSESTPPETRRRSRLAVTTRKTANDGRRRHPSDLPLSSGEGGTSSSTQVVDVSQLFNQMRKDMRRDRVSIEGEIVRAEDGEHHEAIANVLARQILATARGQSLAENGAADSSCASQCQHPVPTGDIGALTEAGALVHSCAILIACTRTSSGGDAYACVHALCRPMSPHVVVCPLSTRASPLEFCVRHVSRAGCAAAEMTLDNSNSTGSKQRRLTSDRLASDPSSPTTFAARLFASLVPSTPSESSPAASAPVAATSCSEHAGAGGLRGSEDLGTSSSPHLHHRNRVDVQVKATTVYRICTSNPQDVPSDTWALVRAVWSQTFSVFGEPASEANFRASAAQVQISISESARHRDPPAAAAAA